MMGEASTTERTERLREAENVVQHALSENPHLFLDSAGEPRIRRPFDLDGEIAWRIDSQRIHSWIARVYYEKENAVLRKEPMERVLVLLAGIAEKQDESDLEVCDAADADPLLRFIISRLRDERYLKITAEGVSILAESQFKDIDERQGRPRRLWRFTRPSGSTSVI